MKYKVTLNGKQYEVEVEKGEATLAAAPAAPAAPAPAPAPAAPAAPVARAAGEVVPCPMPGTIVDVLVTAGEAIKSGQVLVILEAMKMENEIVSPRDGIVAQVVVAKGNTPNSDDPLVILQ